MALNSAAARAERPIPTTIDPPQPAMASAAPQSGSCLVAASTMAMTTPSAPPMARTRPTQSTTRIGIRPRSRCSLSRLGRRPGRVGQVDVLPGWVELGEGGGDVTSGPECPSGVQVGGLAVDGRPAGVVEDVDDLDAGEAMLGDRLLDQVPDLLPDGHGDDPADAAGQAVEPGARATQLLGCAGHLTDVDRPVSQVPWNYSRRRPSPGTRC